MHHVSQIRRLKIAVFYNIFLNKQKWNNKSHSNCVHYIFIYWRTQTEHKLWNCWHYTEIISMFWGWTENNALAYFDSYAIQPETDRQQYPSSSQMSASNIIFCHNLSQRTGVGSFSRINCCRSLQTSLLHPLICWTLSGATAGETAPHESAAVESTDWLAPQSAESAGGTVAPTQCHWKNLRNLKLMCFVWLYYKSSQNMVDFHLCLDLGYSLWTRLFS